MSLAFFAAVFFPSLVGTWQFIMAFSLVCLLSLLHNIPCDCPHTYLRSLELYCNLLRSCVDFLVSRSRKCFLLSRLPMFCIGRRHSRSSARKEENRFLLFFRPLRDTLGFESGIAYWLE